MSAERPYRDGWRFPVRVYWLAWSITSAAAIGLDVKPLLVPLVLAFIAAEAPGLRSRLDRWPTLTEMVGHYLPGWFSFPILGMMVWRLWEWIPGPWVVALASWLIWHFDKMYQSERPV